MIVSLTGGLGNQLFQMYAGLFFEKNKVSLTPNFGNPRETCGLTDLFHFELPPRVDIISGGTKSKIATKVGGLAIRSGLLSNTHDSFLFPKSFLGSAMDIYFSIKLKECVTTFSSTEVGLSPNLPSCNAILFGYFQTYKYYKALNADDKKIALKITTPKFLEMKDFVEKQRPIIVHIRLGDYINEKHFGILSLDYYARSLERLDAEKSNRQVWIFSDDPKNALSFIPSEIEKRSFIVPNNDLSTAETLELMRYGSAYVIANSSFSWWAATLSHTDNPKVIAPSKWFAGMQDPRELLPSEWMTELR
jgi:hypothetical protein